MVTTVTEEVVNQSSDEYDINDPALATYAMDIDTESVPQQVRLAPPPDGVHLVRFRLGNREAGPVYHKVTKSSDGSIVDVKVIALLSGRVINRETGEEGPFIKDWYPTTQVFRGSKGSQITAVYYLTTGKPIPASNPKIGVTPSDIKTAIETLFAEREYVDLYVKTRWIKSVPQTYEAVDAGGHATGIYYYVEDENGHRVYDETKGEKKIKALMLAQGVEVERAHLWYDPVAEETRSVNAEVASLEDSSKFETV